MVTVTVVTCPLAPVRDQSHHLSVLEEESPGEVKIYLSKYLTQLSSETRVLSQPPAQCPA